MIKTIFGLILLLIPFLLIFKFEDKRKGFCYILSFLITFHLVVAILTQTFGIFKYNIIIGINLLIAGLVLTKIDFSGFFLKVKKIKIDWVLLFIVIILFIQFFSVHYDYTGKISTVLGNYKDVNDIKYVYPYFSDEWIAVSLTDYSIDSGKLPLKNPLWHNSFFPNLELPFHSFISEIILLLELSSLTQYTILTIFSGLILCLLVYLILIVNHAGKLASAIACLSVPYIVNGANLPGIWNLMPLTLGIISFLLSFLFMFLNDKKMIFLTAFLTLIFYPPLFVLYSISFLFYFIFSKISKREKIRIILIYLIICIIITFILFSFIFFSIGSFNKSVLMIKEKLFYETFTKGGIPDFSIWKIIPIPVLILAFFGILGTIKKRLWLIMPVFVGLIYWGIYSKCLGRFIIEYERVVVFISILIVLLSGFGLFYLLRYIRKINFVKKYKFLQITKVLVLILFLLFSFSYTERDNWQELKLHSVYDDTFFNPAAPANNYLSKDDLELFKNIEKKNFLSIPWKGLVLGVSTKNYPLNTKEATITNKLINFNYFMETSCNEKIKMTLIMFIFLNLIAVVLN